MFSFLHGDLALPPAASSQSILEAHISPAVVRNILGDHFDGFTEPETPRDSMDEIYDLERASRRMVHHMFLLSRTNIFCEEHPTVKVVAELLRAERMPGHAAPMLLQSALCPSRKIASAVSRFRNSSMPYHLREHVLSFLTLAEGLAVDPAPALRVFMNKTCGAMEVDPATTIPKTMMLMRAATLWGAQPESTAISLSVTMRRIALGVRSLSKIEHARVNSLRRINNGYFKASGIAQYHPKKTTNGWVIWKAPDLRSLLDFVDEHNRQHALATLRVACTDVSRFGEQAKTQPPVFTACQIMADSFMGGEPVLTPRTAEASFRTFVKSWGLTGDWPTSMLTCIKDKLFTVAIEGDCVIAVTEAHGGKVMFRRRLQTDQFQASVAAQAMVLHGARKAAARSAYERAQCKVANATVGADLALRFEGEWTAAMCKLEAVFVIEPVITVRKNIQLLPHQGGGAVPYTVADNVVRVRGIRNLMLRFLAIPEMREHFVQALEAAQGMYPDPFAECMRHVRPIIAACKTSIFTPSLQRAFISSARKRAAGDEAPCSPSKRLQSSARPCVALHQSC